MLAATGEMYEDNDPPESPGVAQAIGASMKIATLLSTPKSPIDPSGST
jgi:hypothetical protein